MGVFGCLEVTIGFFGKQRVDYMTYDTRGIFRCYEVKVSLSDFHSNAALSFVGNYNYFVLSRKLYKKVKDEIPDGIGAYVGDLRGDRMVLTLEKKPRKKDISGEMYHVRRSVGGRSTVVETPLAEVLKDSMIRSLCRDSDKLADLDGDALIRTAKHSEKRVEKAEKKLSRLLSVLECELGSKKAAKLTKKAGIQ